MSAFITKVGIGTLIWMSALVISLIVLVYLLIKSRKNRDKGADLRKGIKANGTNYAMWLFRIFKNAPILKRYFKKVFSRVTLYYPADIYSINKKVTNILFTGTAVGALGIVGTLLISGGSIYFICAGFLVTLVLINAVTNKSLDKLEFTVLNQLAGATSKIRHYYQETGIVETALALSLDELPYEISLHIKTIYDIIINPELKFEVDKYVSVAPNKYLITLLSICATVKEMGDKRLADGTSVFINDLNYLKDEINQEIITTRKNENAYRGATVLALAPVLAIKPIEAWAKSNIDQIASYYDGIYGIVAMMSIFAIAYITYKVIITLKDKERVTEKGETITSRLIEKLPYVDSILTKIIQKNYGKYQRIDKDMQTMGDYSGPRVYLMNRFLSGIGVFLIVVIILFSSNLTQKIAYISDFSGAFSESVVPSEEYRDTMRETALLFAKEYKSKGIHQIPTTEELTTTVMESSSVTSEAYANEVAALVIERLNNYYNSYFKYWYLLIAIILGIGASYIQDIMFKIKAVVIQSRREEEVIQFQNLMLILMHMDGITVSEILEWMERFSFCFKEDIAECRVNLSQGIKKALESMKNKTIFEPFSDFIDNLISVDRVGVAEAFDEIQTDREYYKEKRQIDAEERIKKKSNVASLISFVPMLTTIVIYLVAPMVMYAFNMLNEMNNIII